MTEKKMFSVFIKDGGEQKNQSEFFFQNATQRPGLDLRWMWRSFEYHCLWSDFRWIEM